MSSNLIDMPIITALDENGDTINGAKLYSYKAGTTTPEPLYLDSEFSAEAPNPISANSAGRFVPLWGRSGQAYKLVLKTMGSGPDQNAPGQVEVWTVDNHFVTSTEGVFVTFPLRKVYKVSIPTLLIDGIELFNMVVERPYTLKAQSTRNKMICRTVPTADFTCSIKKNGVEVIAVQFTAGQASATLTGAELNVGLLENDILSCDPPAVIDATAARFAISLELDQLE